MADRLTQLQDAVNQVRILTKWMSSQLFLLNSHIQKRVLYCFHQILVMANDLIVSKIDFTPLLNKRSYFIADSTLSRQVPI